MVVVLVEAGLEAAGDSPGDESTGIAGTWGGADSGSFFLFPSCSSVESIYQDDVETHHTLLLPPGENKSEPLGAEAEEDEDAETHPGVEESEDRIEVQRLLARELDVGRVGEAPDHDEEEVSDGESLALDLQVLHHVLLPGLRRARVEDNNKTEKQPGL